MQGNGTRFEDFLAGEVRKYKGIAVPVKSSLLRRLLVKRLPCRKLHPNPEDEFCDPKIGPNYGIIGQYERNIADSFRSTSRSSIDEPLTVERIRPDGYMILNGHHRWAASIRMNKRSVPVRIVNLTHEMDIRQMLENAKHHRRVTLDLNEVVFRAERDELTEKALRFPLNRIFRENLHVGVTALLRYCSTHGYDIWVFTPDYYSVEYIRRLFKAYHVFVTGIVTGIGQKARLEIGKKLRALIASHYQCTVTIDAAGVLNINEETGDYRQFKLTSHDAGWSQEVIDILKSLDEERL